MRAHSSSCFSVMFGITIFFSRSCAIAVEITSSRPAAVDSAAASPPAATSAITQSGSLAISGLASTMMSRSMVSSLRSSVARTEHAAPSPFLSSPRDQPGLSPSCSNQLGASAVSDTLAVLRR